MGVLFFLNLFLIQKYEYHEKLYFIFSIQPLYLVIFFSYNFCSSPYIFHDDCGDNDVVYVDIPDLSPSTLTASKIPIFQVFPNPTRHQTQLYFPNTNLLKGKEVVLEVFDLQGKLVHSLQRSASTKERSFWELDVSDWRRGMYVLQLKVEGEVAATQRLVVE